MSEGNNQGENQRSDFSEEIKVNNGSSNSDKILEEIQSLRDSVDVLKKTIEQTELAAPVENVGSDKVVKILKEDEAGVERSDPQVSDFAAKYKEQMKQQMAAQDPIQAQRPERTGQRDATRRAKEEQREALRRVREQQKEALRKEREQQRLIRAQRRAEQRQRKLEEDETRRKERKARARELQKKREIRAEVKRQKRLAAKSAKLGGGVVEAHDTQISTEIKPVAKYSIRDLLGTDLRRKLKAAKTEEERQEIRQEHEAKTAEARQAAEHLRMVRRSRFKSTALGRFIGGILSFSERHKRPLLLVMGMVLIVCVGLAGYFNYYTLYEYSYNGQTLGYVKNKDDVLRITDLVQKELSTDKDVQVVIDAKDDIVFTRVSSMDKDIVADSSDEVLRRLTYMGDLNVKAWGVYVNDRKMGSVRDKESVANVLKKLEERYFSGKEGAEVEKAEVQETIDARKSNTDLRNVLSEDEMVEKLCTSGEKESIHTTAEGEHLSDIAAQYQTTEEKILEDNPDLDPAKLTAGVSIVIKQEAPPVTVRLTEKRDYDHVIEYKTIENKTDEMYEGEEEIEQEGEDGEEEIKERYVSINGKIDEENKEILERNVIKKAVNKIVTVGTAERPPSVGDGVFIWPLESGYTLTSRFGHRWGRLHAGIDLGTRTGNDVLAADGGIVTRAGYFGGYGLCVDVDHQNGMSTRYGHLSQTLVSVGDEVYEGQHIAESGNTGFSTGAHLHFEIHVNGSATDPLNYLP